MEALFINRKLFPWVQSDEEIINGCSREVMTAEEFGVYCYIAFRVGGIGEVDLNPHFVMHDLTNKSIGAVNEIIQSVLRKTQAYSTGTILKQIDPCRPHAKSPNITIQSSEVQNDCQCDVLTADEYLAISKNYQNEKECLVHALWLFMAIKSHLVFHFKVNDRKIIGGLISTQELKWWTSISEQEGTCFDYVQTLVKLGLIIKEPGKTGYPCIYALGNTSEDLEVVKKAVKDRREKMAKMFAKE